MRFLLCILVLLAPAWRLKAGDDPLTHLRPEHPRLILTREILAGLPAAAKADPLRAKLHAQIVATAESQLLEPPIRHVLVGPRMLAQSRSALAQVTTCAFAYRLTGEPRFLAHARTIMLTAAAFPDWNPAHFLDVAEMAAALAFGYDWLYDDLSPADRAIIRQALVDKALVFAAPAYARTDPERESFPFVKGNLTNNWNQVCNGGFVLAAMAVAEDRPDLARTVLAGVRATLPIAMQSYEPDGAYPEGPVYWGYGTRYHLLILAALDSALGQDFDLGGAPGFARTGIYRVQVQSPGGLGFNYADGRPELPADPSLAWLGEHHHQPAATALARKLLEELVARGPDPDDGFLAIHALWFPAAAPHASMPPLDVKFDGPSRIAIFRGAWSDPNALWTGLKAGSNRVNHGHLDLGSFMLDSDGERWAVDLGPDDYDLPGYWDKVTGQRWQYYRLNNRSHNTLTIDGALQSPDANAPLTSFASSPSRAFAIADLTSAYGDAATSIRRGLLLLDRARVLVQDDLTGLRAGRTVTWRMLTGAHIQLDGPRATLTQNGKTLRLEILAPAGLHFAAQPARPPTAAENQNEGITALSIAVPAGETHPSDLRLAVLLTPVGERWPAAPAPRVKPLSEWK